MPRPSFKPMKDQRKLIKSLAAMGLPHEDICTVLRLRSPKTLRKYFHRELFEGVAEATAQVSRTAFEMAISGDYPAMTYFWLKCQVPSYEELDTQEEKKATNNRPFLIFSKPQRTEEELDAAA
jgi:hypothetical protein